MAARRFGLFKAAAAGASTALGLNLFATNGPTAHAKGLRSDEAGSRLLQPPGNAKGMLDVWMGACPTPCMQRNGDAALCMQWFDPYSVWQRSIRSAATEWSNLVDQAVKDCLPDTWMLHGRPSEGESDEQAQRVLGLVVLLDQVPRILHLDERKFVGQERALELAHSAVDEWLHHRLPASQRVWLYFPMLHSERLSDQLRATLLFEELVEENTEFRVIMPSVHAHREAVKRFGRLPERNVLLGRNTTAAEREFLVEHPTC